MQAIWRMGAKPKIKMNYWVFLFSVWLLFYNNATAQQTVEQPILPVNQTQKNGFYNLLWGKHYRHLYAYPIKANNRNKNQTIGIVPYIDAFQYYQHFDVFQDLYQEDLYQDTYLKKFLADTYTMHLPIAHLIADAIATEIELPTQNNQFYFLENKLYIATKDKSKLLTTEQVLEHLHKDFSYKIDQVAYVRSRILDMIIGNGLGVTNSYFWTLNNDQFAPAYVDRQHAFLKKDGLLFNTALKSIGVPKTKNYYNNKIKNINVHNYHIDLALAQQIDYSLWSAEAQKIQTILNNQTINKIFNQIQNQYPDYYSEELKQQLISNIADLQKIIQHYTEQSLKQIVVLTGSEKDDIIEVLQNTNKTAVSIRNNNKEVFYGEYTPNTTQEIWIYSLGGKDKITIKGKNKIILRVVNDDPQNQYNLQDVSQKTRIYTTLNAPIRKKNLDNARLYKTNNPEILKYNKLYPKYNTWSFMPGVSFDTDLKFRFGGKFTFTRYNFTRQPFSAQHQVGWNRFFTFQYKGIFPSITGRKTYWLEGWKTSPEYFENFFGYGNQSQNHESLFGMDYNRIRLDRTGIQTAILFNISKNSTLKFTASVEDVKVSEQQNFVRDDVNITRIDTVNIIQNVYANANLIYTIGSDKKSKDAFRFFLSPEAGVIVPLNNTQKYIPYIGSSLMMNLEGEKLILASLIRAKALLNNQFDFFQAATMGGNQGLRGFRNDRFSGQKYFVHSTDLRYDLGILRNKLLPITYEAFLGFDYGRVWLQGEDSQKWHTSVGGGFSFKLLNKFPVNFSYFTSSEKPRMTLSLGYEF